MADISKIKLPSGTTYDIKDATARSNYAPKLNGVYYGVCDTEQATKAKAVTLTNGTNFSLAAGAIVCIKFTYASTAATMTLNVNSTGAKNMVLYGTTAMSSGTTTNGWRAGAVVPFVYDGTNWVRMFWENTTYSNMSQSEATTGTATTARAISAKVLHDTFDGMFSAITNAEIDTIVSS